jgi:hypothetical protein
MALDGELHRLSNDTQEAETAQALNSQKRDPAAPAVIPVLRDFLFKRDLSAFRSRAARRLTQASLSGAARPTPSKRLVHSIALRR